MRYVPTIRSTPRESSSIKTLSIISFNTHGLRNFHSIINDFLQFDVVFICETWTDDGTTSLPPGYRSVCVPPTRGERGRPAGGLVLFIRSSIAHEITYMSQRLISLRIKTGPIFNLVCCYWCPTDSINEQIAELKETLSMDQFGQSIVIGDLNCRMGPGPDRIDSEIPFNSLLTRSRNSRDNVKSSRGKQLSKTISDEGLLIINGRSTSDPNGDFTFVSATGK